jgi:putative membrane protein
MAARLAEVTDARYLGAMNDQDQDRVPGETALRDRLALDRTHLANERTALAHARTAIMLFVTGGSLIKLFAPQPAALTSGWILVLIGLAVFARGVWRYLVLRSGLRRLGRPERAP